ncbi:transporter substrate-binding domain-containing protein [Clostridium sp. YIM B02505]|uniref:Transporter substrate-binding domain-containing protein n=1 Tax=Clostridium yunnanense TaxID=2800325 RepID=A0ABS1EJZ2_9CLOT|nr:transporter substrate-binding domain-containing protein [Clostridium yunnanense]MBK1809686.1 transporter substrate-binding domain-containing protein [Clostridium yunnanense]
MKKITSILILALTLTLAGCSSAPSKTASNSGGSSKPADIQKIIDRGTLKVGVKVDVPKYGYKDPSTGKIEGFEIDIAKAVAKKILGDENKVDLQAVTAKTRGPLLDSGEIDMVAATFTVTEERKKSYNFSDPYFTDGVGLLVKKDAGVSSFKDLNGKKIGVAQSSTTKKALQEEADKQGIKVTFSEFASYPEIKTALSSGRVDCFSVDGAILLGYLDDNTKILSDKFSPQNYGIASKKDNTELAKVINETITEMKSSGDLQKLIDKWGLK